MNDGVPALSTAEILPADRGLSVDHILERPTRVRFGVLAFLCSLSFVLYLDRVCMGKAAPEIQRYLGVSNTAMGFVHWAFMVSYGLFEVPTGRWGDKYGSRGVIARIVLWWSVFTALTGSVSNSSWDWSTTLALPFVGVAIPLAYNGFVRLMAIRFLFGAGEAGAFPNVARVVARWFPGKARSPAQGLVIASAQIGGAISPVLAAYLISWVGWRWTFFIFGLIGVAWAIAFYAWFRDDPSEHRWVNDAERRLLAPGAASASAEHHQPIPWRLVLSNPNIWLLGLAMNAGAFCFYMYVSWYPTYLESARGVDSIYSGWLSSMILVGGAIGCLSGGYIGDLLVRRLGDRRMGRAIVGCGGFAVASVCIIASVHCDSPVVATLFVSAAFCFGQAQLSSWWAVATDISGKHLGALFGLMNSLGAFGGGGSQIFFGWFGDHMARLGHSGRAQWDPAFYVYAAAYAIGSLAWLLIDPNKSAVGDDSPDDAVTV